MTNITTRAAFLFLVIASGILIGTLTAPGNWYASLAKPSFNPPSWVFGPVWTTLYVLIAMAGWRAWEAGRSSPEMKLWWTQLGLNFLWSPTFFAMQQPWIAFAIILALLAVILAFIRLSWPSDRVSAVSFVPYALWVAFASALNLSIAILN
ncbi:tryptophan-rich sensory protein [Phaeobacter gallaeciensis]|uniref:Tryptophan-rich sensory protein n=2 Tax=Roseobacteraceae TaxID=2854170 RepID=A0A366WQB2_9RHOB|nr:MULTISPECIES: TspO/MBR family protein [Roseobacteraceae]MBT3139762.1 tryptophan-rich sensory protein [Falsiruegeria litorea]RBW51337.1 tryptophan-rich sensory protein [Phaeobacter gallaeciensis]